jgi:3-deoxy-D-manno-octulosonic-acid transferase
MITGYDIAYSIGLAASAPVWGLRSKTRDKVLKALGQRMGYVTVPTSLGDDGRVLIHAVSLGEMNATVEMVAQLQAARPGTAVVISTTTDTGYERGRKIYGGRGDAAIVKYPLDFSAAIERFLDEVDPAVAVLMEGELWPNFLLICQRRKIPVLLVNGRMTPSAFDNYSRLPRVVRKMLRRLAFVGVQDAVYLDRFKRLGSPVDRTAITGTMKFDTARVGDPDEAVKKLRDAVGIVPGEPVWVCGSTGPGEEAILVDVFRRLLHKFPQLRLVIVPRHPQRFDEVAKQVEAEGFAVLRRSTGAVSTGAKHDRPVIVGDTMGELRNFYGIADVVFVGRSLVDLGHRQHGSDMIEPAGLGRPVVVGEWTHNFAQPMRALRDDNAVRQVDGADALFDVLAGWLADPAAAAELGRRARDVIVANRGATKRHVDQIMRHLK